VRTLKIRVTADERTPADRAILFGPMRPPRRLRPVTPPPDPFGDQETDDPVRADTRNFYKVERWTADDQHVAALLYAGNRLDQARATFDQVVTHRPGGRYTIRQRARVLAKWPKDDPVTSS
jgi:hypothetical protein